jgi:hypothetical protein
MLKIENVGKIKGKVFGEHRFEITNVYEHLAFYYFEVLDIGLEIPTHRTVKMQRRQLGFESLYELSLNKGSTHIKLTIESIKDIDILCNYIETLLID